MNPHVFKRLCDQLLRRVTRDQAVVGVLVFGSAIRGPFDQYSDIDFYILRKRQGPEARRNERIGSRRLDIIIQTITETKKTLRIEYGTVRRPLSQMLASGRILWSRTDDLVRLKRRAQQNLRAPTRFRQDEILMHLYSIEDFFDALRRDRKERDVIAFGVDSELLIGNLVELFLKLHRSYFRPPREMAATLLNIDRRVARLLRQYYCASSFSSRVRVLTTLVHLLQQMTGGPLPRRWVIRSERRSYSRV